MNKCIQNTYVQIIASVILAALFCLKFSVTTSPFYHLHGMDSAVFHIIGKYWAQGSIPYVDLWDHKGPIIFFINYLGVLLTEGKAGVLLIQILSLSVFIFFTYKSFNHYLSVVPSFLLTICALFWLECSYLEGNLTEEYILPFLACNFYYTMLWAENIDGKKTEPYPLGQAFLLGFILAFAFLTRLTNALGACGVAAGVFLILLSSKQWKNLAQCIVSYILGFVVLTLPFIAYFASHNALDEMMFGTFFYNVSNISETSTMNSSLQFYFSRDKILFTIMAVNCYGLLGVSALQLILSKGREKSSIIWFLATLLLGLWYLKSATMEHYRTVAVPFFPVLFIALVQLRRKFLPVIWTILLVMLVSGPVLQTMRKWSCFVDYMDDTNVTDVLVQKAKEIVPSESFDKLVLYSCPPSTWLRLDLKPLYRNFSFPETQSWKSERLREDILNEYNSLKAEWVLCKRSGTLIQDILDVHYERTYDFPGISYSLWKLKQEGVHYSQSLVP